VAERDDEEQLVAGRDFYYEGAYLVFTAEYLRRRGFCCRSGCRHCPYGFVREQPLNEQSEKL